MTFDVPCEVGAWTYAVSSERQGCIQPRESEVEAFVVEREFDVDGGWPIFAGSATACPAGDGHAYTATVAVEPGCVASIAPALLTLEALPADPPNRKLAFFPNTTSQPADSAATPANGYSTTITERQVGGCGSDSAAVYLDGVEIGKVRVGFLSNYDLSGNGAVDAGDIAILATALGSCWGDANFDRCANYQHSLPNDCIDAADLNRLAVHVGHDQADPMFKAGASAGTTRLVPQPGAPPGMVDLALELDGVSGTSAYGAVLRADPAKLRFMAWLPDASVQIAAVVDTVGAQGPRLVVVVPSVVGDPSGQVQLGTLRFERMDQNATEGDVRIAYEDVATHASVLASLNTNTTKSATMRAASLLQNHPNPFNPSTTIRYSLRNGMHVRLAVFDVAGRRVRTLTDGLQIAGEHAAVWDGRDESARDVPAGIYVYRLETPDSIESRKLVLLK